VEKRLGKDAAWEVVMQEEEKAAFWRGRAKGRAMYAVALSFLVGWTLGTFLWG